MFSNTTSTCGSRCGLNQRESRSTTEIKKMGWTNFHLSTDTPHKPANSKHPGENEHYFYYLNKSNRRRTEVYDKNGNQFTNCVKKAIAIRERGTHRFWWDLRTDYTLLVIDN